MDAPHACCYRQHLPHAGLAIYCTTKAALHSYILSQRYRLRGSSVAVIEIAPPMVATALDRNADNPHVIPLDAYIAETRAVMESGDEEVLVASARERRDRLRNDAGGAMARFNNIMRRRTMRRIVPHLAVALALFALALSALSAASVAQTSAIPEKYRVPTTVSREAARRSEAALCLARLWRLCQGLSADPDPGRHARDIPQQRHMRISGDPGRRA